MLAETGAVQRRLRVLPSRVGPCFVLAMCLFPGTGYRGVWAKLTAGLDASRSDARALRDLRQRVGTAPPQALFALLAGRRPGRAPRA